MQHLNTPIGFHLHCHEVPDGKTVQIFRGFVFFSHSNILLKSKTNLSCKCIDVLYADYENHSSYEMSTCFRHDDQNAWSVLYPVLHDKSSVFIKVL